MPPFQLPAVLELAGQKLQQLLVLAWLWWLQQAEMALVPDLQGGALVPEAGGDAQQLAHCLFALAPQVQQHLAQQNACHGTGRAAHHLAQLLQVAAASV